MKERSVSAASRNTEMCVFFSFFIQVSVASVCQAGCTLVKIGLMYCLYTCAMYSLECPRDVIVSALKTFKWIGWGRLGVPSPWGVEEASSHGCVPVRYRNPYRKQGLGCFITDNTVKAKISMLRWSCESCPHSRYNSFLRTITNAENVGAWMWC